jgi:hypothetical protein
MPPGIFCPHGHLRTPANVVRDPTNPDREPDCRICRRERSKRYRARLPRYGSPRRQRWQQEKERSE